MPLNKLENFIKNTEGRILYVNPNDLDSTDAIDNQGNSLTKPFKTIQRALIESARFSYVAGDDNDLIERTTILLFPGDHIVDNRPGFGIKDEGVAKAVAPGGATTGALNTFTLTLNSNFDLTQEDNILYKFNSVYGGVVVPRGTSIVGLDLRKTKIRPLYVPNPTDNNVGQSAIFRITGACYFWQFTFFDGDDTGLVYTDPVDFSTTNQSKPVFSHHKLTCFEYADGVTKFEQYSDLTDLDMYYSKLSNAYNEAAAKRAILQKYPSTPKGFAPQRPEFEIVGAFATDPLKISNIESGDGFVPGQVVTVTTNIEHNLTGGTPIKIRGINVEDYNISTKVSNVIDATRFQYSLPFVRPNLPAGSAGGLSSSNGQVLVETDTVSGASPYIFNTSLRSVYGMQGMHADGKKATGFRSMVVAQFTAVSLQKDDRAFVKYDSSSRSYGGIVFSKETGALLSSKSSSTNPNTVYHLDQEANYRKGWRTTHIKVSNDAVVQIVSVFAIGFHSHFNMINGADASITNSNSNFGTFSLAAEGFKKDAFAKDDKGFITSVITPRSIVTTDQEIEFLQLIKDNASSTTKLYLFGQTSLSVPPSHIVQGFRLGAKDDEKIFVDASDGNTYQATVVMNEPSGGSQNVGQKSFKARHSAASASKKNVFTIDAGHNLANGETIRIIADNGDLPENIDPHTVYFAITNTGDSDLSATEIRIASSKTNAELADPIFINTIASTSDEFNIISRVSDKKPGDVGHPIQYDSTRTRWFVHTLAAGNTLHAKINDGTIGTDDISYIIRKDDDRSLDEKVYKLRYVVPKELTNGRDPVDGFVLQDSNFTTVLNNSDFTKTSITSGDYAFDRNTRFISQASFDSTLNLVTIRSDKPHNLNVGDQIVVKNILSSTNTTGLDGKGYNGTFSVDSILNDKEFRYSNTDVENLTHLVGTFTNNTHTRTTLLPRFSRNDNKDNFFIYRTEVVTPYIDGVQDGIYHLFVLNSDNAMTESSGQFSENKYNQNIVNLYPEYDRDNTDANPPEASTFAKRFPLGDVVTNDLKKSITRETTNKFLESFDATNTISAVTNNNTNAVLTFPNEHGLNSLKMHASLTGGGGHTNGTYFNIRLLDNNNAPASSTWRGATADVTVSGNAVTAVKIVEGGSGYVNGNELFFDSSTVDAGGIGGSPSAKISVNTLGISTAIGNYVQVTGISTGSDSYHRITTVNSNKEIVVAKTTSETILVGQQVIDLGPWTAVGSASFSSSVTTFNTTAAHGLVVGNKFTVLNSSDAKLGEFIVASVPDVDTFTATTTSSLSDPKYILKHGLSDNEALSSKAGENLGVRGLSIFDHETLVLNESINSSLADFKVKLPNLSGSDATDATSITNRFPLGSYIQIDGEIMRVASSSLSGAGDDISVIRGALGTISSSHPINSKIKKIKPLPIELRRPSILRASGHTFEYVGYGPGNYSTALPQLQNRSLSEREEFLTQSQETSCGNVVYTGMNDKGDFYIGNTKIASASGQQTTFDIPIPTITGEDPNRLSLVADEVIIKERLLVEGGTSKQILSQFDGPVTFNENVRLANQNKRLDVTGEIKVASTGNIRVHNVTNSTSTTTGSIVTLGGVGIGKSMHIGGDIVGSNTGFDIGEFAGVPDIVGFGSVTALKFYGDGANLTNTGAQMSEPATGEHRVVLTDVFSGTMLTGFTDSTLKFNLGDDNLISTKFTGNLTGNVTGNVTGNSDTATTAANLSFGSASQVVFKNSSNNGATSSNLTFDGNDLAVNDGDIIGKKFLLLNGTASNSGDIHTTGGDDGIAVIQNTSNQGSVRIAGKNSGGSVVTIASFNIESNQPILRCEGDIVAFNASDINLKDNITIIPNALDKINSLSGNTFTWKSGSYNESLGDDTGVIAQEVEALGLPGLTTTRDDGTKAVRYERLIPVLIQAVKELSAKVTALEGS